MKEQVSTLEKGANILLSLMQLNIGGAETHVVELAKELKRKGFNVIVTSNGGVYVKELEDSGIKHYAVPLQNKNPLNMLKSARLLKKIIKDEKIDIVHSHARIPSFILGKLHKRMKLPFVTTAHWVFNTGYGLKYITDWGEKTVAVSEDIKTYLMDNYHIPSGDINVTINGIDTEKFSPKTDCEDIKKELGIKDEDTVITYVSRLDESRSLVAKQLIEAVPEIDKVVDNLKVIVVGAGDDYNNVKTMADSVNQKLGRDVIVLTGARTDISYEHGARWEGGGSLHQPDGAGPGDSGHGPDGGAQGRAAPSAVSAGVRSDPFPGGPAGQGVFTGGPDGACVGL